MIVEPEKKLRKSKRLNWKRVGFLVLALFFFLLAGIGGGIYSILSALGTEGGGEHEYYAKASQLKPGERINVLFLGIDADRDAEGNVIPADLHKARTRADVVILVSLDPITGEVGVLSIPRDTRVPIMGHGLDKLTHAHAYGGPQLMMETVSNFLDVPIHYFVRTNFDGFSRIIDALGGVEMEIEKNMYYEDPYQNLVIDIKKGRQVLDGEKALQVMRYRQYWNGDIGRVEVQHEFLQALMKKVFGVGMILKLPSLTRELVDYVDTNMTPAEMLRLANMARRIERDQIEMGMLAGNFGPNGIYWIADPHQEVVDRLIRGIDREENSKIRLEVLNGTGIDGAAGRLAALLKDRGYQVVRVGNADSFDFETTWAVNRSGNQEAFENVAVSVGRLGNYSVKVKEDVSEEAVVDVTIIIGKDFAFGENRAH